MKAKQTKMNVQGTEITIYNIEHKDYISLTDIAKYRNKEEPFSIINNWMRSRSTIDFLGLWEKLSNPCLLYTSPSPRDVEESRMPSSA